MTRRLILVFITCLLVMRTELHAALDRPKLQIINGTPQVVDVFWINEKGERVPNGSVPPGKHTIISTTLGHRFAIVGREDQKESLVTAEVRVQAFRVGGLPAFYTQQASAGGFPVVASARVNPYALKEAVYIIDMMLSKRPDVRAAMVKSGARLSILAHNEFTCDQPEWAWLADEPVEGHEGIPTRDFRDARARGMGGSLTDPYCSCAEENLLACEGDPYSTENILIHELAHNIHLRGMSNVDATFDPRVKACYDTAMKAGLWKGKYASVNHHEYFAEGVQSWFDNNRENDHDHNHVNTRAELLDYDPGLAALCREVFGDTVLKYTKPQTRLTGHLEGYDPKQAPKFVWPPHLKKARELIRAKARARSEAANKAHETKNLVGWTLHISPKTDPAALNKALPLLQAQLEEIMRVVPVQAVIELQKVPLWINPEYPKVPPRAEYHPGAGWLKENGRDPAMAKGVEFTNVRTFEAETRRMPNFALHELAHAFHDRVLGFEHPQIEAAYQKAKSAGLYDRLQRQDSEGRKRLERAYAMTNAKEYFAECSEAFFTKNDFYPFTQDELQKHDPEMFELLTKLWGTSKAKVVSALAEKNAAKAAATLPNILLILADDLGYGDVRCYNADAKVPTPNIDRLAIEGMRFTDAHSPATVCTPSRYSLMTGQMAFRVPNGGTVFTGAGGPSLIAPGKLTLPGMLKQQGYATAAFGKWHVGLTFRDVEGKPIHAGGLEAIRRIDFSRRIEGGPLDHGFDRFFGTACCPTTDWLYAFIDGDRIPTPPTSPLDRSTLPKHPYANDCRQGLIAPDFPMEEVDLVFLKKSREFIAQHARTSPKQPFFLYHATQAVHLPSFAAPEFQGKSKAGPHGDFIAEFDHIVGELMRELDQHGLADNTLVILSSDNGPEVASIVHMRADHAHDGAKPWRGIKRDAWEGGHRVPFIVRWPAKVKPGTTSDQTLCLTDILATVAAITDTELPPDAAEDSFNLLPALEGTATAPIRPYLLTQAFAGQRTLSIRRGQWEYIAHRGSGGNNYDKVELKPFALPDTDPEAPAQLYDLANDPGETTNLYSKRLEIVKELQALLEQSKATGRSRP